MIEYRRYKRSDIEQLVTDAQEHLQTTVYKDIKFSREKLTDLLVGNERNISFYLDVAVQDEEIIGGLCAQTGTYIFSHEAQAQDNLFYVKPTKRDLIVATTLVERYVNWAKERKVRRILLRNSMGVNVEGFAKFATKLGFTQTGTIHMKEL